MLTKQDQSLVRVKWLQTSRRWKKLNLDSFFQSLGFFFLLALFWAICFRVVANLCNNIYTIDVIGPIILQRISSFGFLAGLIIVAGGHVLTSFSALYRGRELFTLMQCPYPIMRLYHVQCLEALILGGWVSGMFILPVLLAYGWQLNASIIYYPIIIVGLICFLIIAGFIGILIMLILAKWIIGRPIRSAISSLLFIICFGIFIVYLTSRSQILIGQIQEGVIGEVLANLQLSSNPFLPSHWMARLMIAARIFNVYEICLYLGALIATALFLGAMVRELGQRWYQDAWFWTQEHTQLFSMRLDRRYRRRRFWLTRLFPRSVGAIIHKEIQVFKRDFSQWGQLVLILTLVLFYVAHTQNIIFDEQASRAHNQLVFFNVILLGFIQATLSLRYTFPSISLEGKAYWNVASSGIGYHHYYFTKYYLHTIVLLFIGLGMGFMLNLILGVDSALNFASMVVLFLFAFGFSSFSMGFGVLFRKFEATNAADVTSDSGALVAMIVILIYFGVSVSIFARFALDHIPGVDFITQLSLQRELVLWSLIFLVIQTAAILLPSSYGLRILERAEI